VQSEGFVRPDNDEGESGANDDEGTTKERTMTNERRRNDEGTTKERTMTNERRRNDERQRTKAERRTNRSQQSEANDD